MIVCESLEKDFLTTFSDEACPVHKTLCRELVFKEV